MPAEHFVPRFANTLHASPRVQANALKALAMAAPKIPETEWRELAAAALIVGADWAGEDWNEADVARQVGVKEQTVAKHYEQLAASLKKMGR